MIRKDDGLVKVLDFGLAKMTVPQSATIDPEADTQLQNTSPGVVISTVAYMSPEQARGDTVDERTDMEPGYSALWKWLPAAHRLWRAPQMRSFRQFYRRKQRHHWPR